MAVSDQFPLERKLLDLRPFHCIKPFLSSYHRPEKPCFNNSKHALLKHTFLGFGPTLHQDKQATSLQLKYLDFTRWIIEIRILFKKEEEEKKKC
ncbi:MAG: hypothetical protein AB2693_21470 [Candidatus Thiodiazotropha sp.]